MLEYLYGKMSGSKIAWASRKEGDRVVAGPPDIFPYKYSNIFKPSHPLYLSAYEDETDRMFRNVGI